MVGKVVRKKGSLVCQSASHCAIPPTSKVRHVGVVLEFVDIRVLQTPIPHVSFSMGYVKVARCKGRIVSHRRDLHFRLHMKSQSSGRRVRIDSGQSPAEFGILEDLQKFN